MLAADLALLMAAAQIAGKIALSHWKASPQVWEKPDGQGPVSAADLEVNAALAQVLRAARPDYGWLSEETPDSAERLSTPAQFILDPIDGTRSFLQGDAAFSVTVLAEAGLVSIVPGLLIKGNATPLTVRAFAATADVITIHGFVNRITV